MWNYIKREINPHKYSGIFISILFISGILLKYYSIPLILTFFIFIFLFIFFRGSSIWFFFLLAGYTHYALLEREINPYKKEFPLLLKGVHKVLQEPIENSFKGDTLNFLQALLLGERTKLNFEIKEKFIRTGTIHFLAISGLHMGILWLVFFVLLLFFRFPFKFSLLCSSFFLFLYSASVPLRPSVLRANLMIFLFVIQEYLERKTIPINTLGLAGFISLAIDPNWLFDIGFQLSYLATFGILFLFPPLYSFIKLNNMFIKKYIIGPLLVSFTAQLFVFPLILYIFKRISIIALLANLILTPLLTLILSSSVLLIFTYYIFPFLILKVQSFMSLIFYVFFFVLNFLSKIPYASLHFSSVSPFVFLIYPFLILFGFFANSKAR